jgi:hypothetical protein
LRVIEKKELREIFEFRRDELTGDGGNYIMRISIICNILRIVLDDQIKEDEMDGTRRAHGEMRNVYMFLVGNLEGKRVR